MIDTIEDVEPPYRSGDSDKVKRRVVEWPTVEGAMSRIRVLVDGEAATDIAARDLIVLMREVGRLTAENTEMREALAASPITAHNKLAAKDKP